MIRVPYIIILVVAIIVSTTLISSQIDENTTSVSTIYLIEQGCIDESCSNLAALELDRSHYSRYPELKFLDDYKELNAPTNVIVVYPIFTQTAYSTYGFYAYYRGDCDSSCLTVSIDYELPFFNYNAGFHGLRVLKFLGYEYITDIDVDKDPKILDNYDKVILLHNEYVTQKMFDAITNHPNVVFLYPNALYAEITVDYENDSITLIRGHGYPAQSILNGFDWKYDNTHPYEYDNVCDDWYFWKIENGQMLSCYPEYKILHDKELLKTIKGI